MKKNSGQINYWILPGKSGGKVAGVSYVVAGKRRAKGGKVSLTGDGLRVSVPKPRLTLKSIVLFALRKRVQIPARPYITPAIQAELPKYGDRFRAIIEKQKRS